MIGLSLINAISQVHFIWTKQQKNLHHSDSSEYNGASVCRVMWSKMTCSAFNSCCAAVASPQACNTTSTVVTTCQELFDSVFTYQNECDGGISSANTILITAAVIIADVLAAVAVFSRLNG
ncbi:hypothetical protein GN958_ATG19726 [Phytophthora infestans]|uniref:Uncharacterized protein n=1 Tax=Phytophthora infestans TaxID=4787 RepID=A0A8S9TR43_PHYIN|nr:hypothetical protein GN958_ATG19726 [Phytophthora infestans]